MGAPIMQHKNTAATPCSFDYFHHKRLPRWCRVMQMALSLVLMLSCSPACFPSHAAMTKSVTTRTKHWQAAALAFVCPFVCPHLALFCFCVTVSMESTRSDDVHHLSPPLRTMIGGQPKHSHDWFSFKGSLDAWRKTICGCIPACR